MQKTDCIKATVAKYVENDWTVIRPLDGVNDIVAQRGKKYHFVQVVPTCAIDNVKYQGIAKNSFIQNAFSNGAIPVYAHVNGKKTLKVTFEDVNANTRIIISARRAVLRPTV